MSSKSVPLEGMNAIVGRSDRGKLSTHRLTEAYSGNDDLSILPSHPSSLVKTSLVPLLIVATFAKLSGQVQRPTDRRL